MICRNHSDVEESVHACSRCGEAFCPDCLVTIQGQPFCGDCKTEQLLDVRSGTDRKLQYAGFWIRFGALVFDWVVFGIPAYFLTTVAMTYVMEESSPPAYAVLSITPLFVFPILYEGLMLMLKNGQTVGKMALRLRVVRTDGSRITATQAWVRTILRIILGCFIIIDPIPFFFTEEKTTLHDWIAGTRVVTT